MFFGNAKVSVSGLKKKKAGSFLPAPGYSGGKFPANIINN
jgi:hypothetical protein